VFVRVRIVPRDRDDRLYAMSLISFVPVSLRHRLPPFFALDNDWSNVLSLSSLSLKRLSVRIFGTIAIGLVSLTTSAEAQTVPETVPSEPEITRINDIFLFQDLTLTAAFTPDPQYLRGIAGGAEAAANTAGIDRTPTGRCIGMINTLPNHRIYLQDFFASLRLRVLSEGDTTIVIRGPGGTWCNDDYDGKNAGIAGQWLAGTYEIWVGSYAAETFSPYELEFSEVILPRSTRDRPAIFRR